MTAPRVTIVITTRDRSELLEAAIDSVLRQTRAVDQVVVVDDGSSPEHRERVEALPGRAASIEVHRIPSPIGGGAARNVGIGQATGDFLVFLDDDDLLHPQLVEDGLAVLQSRPDVGAVSFLYECLYQDGRVPSAEDRNSVPSGLLETSPVSALLRFMIPVSAFLRRSAIGDQRFHGRLPQGEDTWFWINLAARGCRFVRDERVRLFIRHHAGNSTRSRARYRREVQAFYELLLAHRLLPDRDDAYLAHLKLVWFRIATGRRLRLQDVTHVLGAPDRLAAELAFWGTNLARRQLRRFQRSG